MAFNICMYHSTSMQFGITRLEVHVDGSVSYPEPIFDQKDNGNETGIFRCLDLAFI